MSLLDLAILVGSVLVAFAVHMVRRDSLARRLALLLLPLLCAAQLWTEGFYWQFLPAYVLLAMSWARRGPADAASRMKRFALRAGTVVCTVLLIFCWILLPVPRLPAPSGQHPVGTTVFRWELPTREEPATESATDRRSIVVQAWYPTRAAIGAEHAPYIDVLSQLPDRVAGLPRALLAHYDRIDTHAKPSAPAATAALRWPVIIFSPGYGAARAFFTTLVSDLASRGNIVLAMDHPYEGAFAQLVDGRIVGPIERMLPNETNRIPYMIRQTAVRDADIRAVVDAVLQGASDSPFGNLVGQMDGARIAAAGHSFGGAAAVVAAGHDLRIRAAVNIDGTLYGALPVLAPAQRFLLIESDRAETKHGHVFVDGQARLLATLRGAGQRCQIKRANHYSFTDAPLFLAPPWRWLASQLLGGSRGPAATTRLTNELITTFLSDSAGKPLARCAAEVVP